MTEQIEEEAVLLDMQVYVGNLGEDVAKLEERVSDMSVDMFSMKTSQKAMIKLLWSIQEKQIEHDKRFDQLENRMDALESRMDKLEQRMDSMEDILKVVLKTLNEIKQKVGA